MTTTINPAELRGADLFWHIMDRIDRDGPSGQPETPEPGVRFTRWHQGSWRTFIPKTDRCGTAFCVAGYACEITGGRWLFTTDGEGNVLLDGKPCTNVVPELAALIPEPGDYPAHVDFCYDRDVVPAAYRALRLLDLENDGSNSLHVLFAEDNTYDDLVRIGTEVFGPRPHAA